MSRQVVVLTVLGALVVAVVAPLAAQQPQLPTLQVCNATQVSGQGFVTIPRRSDALHTGTFSVRIDLRCAQGGYPSGALAIRIDMSDSIVQGTVNATSFEQVTSTGKHTPTVYINGRCDSRQAAGCRFWLMAVDNKRANEARTPDVVGFLIFNGLGQRVAYGTGPVTDGDIVVAPTGN